MPFYVCSQFLLRFVFVSKKTRFVFVNVRVSFCRLYTRTQSVYQDNINNLTNRFNNENNENKKSFHAVLSFPVGFITWQLF